MKDEIKKDIITIISCYFEQDARWSRIRATLEDMEEKFNIEYKPEYKQG
tara:strand:+ start:740 stop:886 length:147 start_codon:yes stop_codon:yes gene_type:complete